MVFFSCALKLGNVPCSCFSSFPEAPWGMLLFLLRAAFVAVSACSDKPTLNAAQSVVVCLLSDCAFEEEGVGFLQGEGGMHDAKNRTWEGCVGN